MATINVLMPQMGESIQEGTLTKWHKKAGDKVTREETLFEISTDKVDTEIPSPASGILIKILSPEGTTVAVNSVVAVIDDAASATAAAPAEASAAKAVSAPSPSPAASPAPAAVSASAAESRSMATPLARKIAQENSIDLHTVKGTGEGSRIVKNDVLAVLESGTKGTSLIASAAKAANASFSSPAPSAAPMASAQSAEIKAGEDVVDGVRINRVPMTAMRKKIAEHMVMSKRTSPHVTSVIEIDLQKIVDLRAKLKDKFEAQNGFKLTFMPFFLQACVEAIKAVPIVNASVEGDTILYKKDINLGVAVALDWGLIVPVIKNSGEKNVVGLAHELNDLAEKARNKKLAPEDVRGGTFSVSNFGGFGTVIGQPIINQPQVAIFGIGAMQKKPVVINDAIAIRTMCYCVLSFDHRVIDGANSGKFLSTVKNVLENWSLPIL